jgi:signal transduction histidine kinase
LYEGDVVRLVGADGLSGLINKEMSYVFNEAEPDYQFRDQNMSYILLDDVQEPYPQFRQPPSDYIHGWLSVVLKARGNVIGFISLDSRTPGRFTELDAHLALNFANQAAVALENARLFSDLQKELEERKKLIDELAKKNAELEQFTYTVSHDLKSPLVTINGFLGYLEQDTLSGNTERLKKDMLRIQEAVHKMQRLLNELLELSRIGRMMNAPERARFSDLVAEAMEIVQGRVEERGVAVYIDPDLPEVYVDRPRVVEALQNLIDNAAKYMGSQPAPRIEIGHRGNENETPVFFVRDNGIGIPPEHHERIFGLFNKLDARSEGTGVGLALVKRIIEVHGGRIWVESEARMGSTFLFTLPSKPKLESVI